MTNSFNLPKFGTSLSDLPKLSEFESRLRDIGALPPNFMVTAVNRSGDGHVIVTIAPIPVVHSFPIEITVRE